MVGVRFASRVAGRDRFTDSDGDRVPDFRDDCRDIPEDYDGRVLAQADAGPGEKVVVAPIALGTLRAERERRMGHDMRSHLRSELHPYAGAPWFPPAEQHPITLDSNRSRIKAAKRRVDERTRNA